MRTKRGKEGKFIPNVAYTGPLKHMMRVTEKEKKLILYLRRNWRNKNESD